MDPHRMARIDALFQAALGAGVDERQVLLERVGDDDPDPPAEVERVDGRFAQRLALGGLPADDP
jgi:hypothetical protein